MFSIKARAKPEPNQRLKLTGGHQRFLHFAALQARPLLSGVIQRMNRETLNHKRKEIELWSASFS